MQDGLEIKRFPSLAVTIILGLAMALVIGFALGYSLKPTPALATGPTHHLAVTVQPASVDGCEFIDKHKAC